MTEKKDDKKGCQWTILDISEELKTKIVNNAKAAKLPVADYLDKILTTALAQQQHDKDINKMEQMADFAAEIEIMNERISNIEKQA